jgi:hypothetical protein
LTPKVRSVILEERKMLKPHMSRKERIEYNLARRKEILEIRKSRRWQGIQDTPSPVALRAYFYQVRYWVSPPIGEQHWANQLIERSRT